MAFAERTETFDISISKLFQAISDFESYPSFVSGVTKAQVLSSEKKDQITEKKIKLEMDLLKRIEYSILAQEKFSTDSASAELSWVLDNSEYMKVNNGCWKLKSESPQKTLVTYSLEIEFNFPVPGFILKGLVANALPKAMKEFESRARKL